MSLINTDGTNAGMAAIGARAKDAAAQAVPMAQRAGTTAVQGVQTATEWAAPRVQDAVLGAREWAAPRLDDAAEAITVSVAPKVSAALHSAASQVRPTPTSTKTGLSRLLDWRWLVGLGAVAAAAGATAAVAMRRRYASATAAAKAATELDAPADESAAEDTTRSQVNGQVSTAER